MIMRILTFVAACTFLGCNSDETKTVADMTSPQSDADVTSQDAEFMVPDAAVGVGLQTIDGVLTYAAHHNGETHLYSVQADGSQRRRLTENSAHWSFHSVSPDRKYIAAVRHRDALNDGRPNIDSPGVVWILDIRRSESYPLTPETCDAGLGGVSWLDDAFVAFAMRCGDTPSKLPHFLRRPLPRCDPNARLCRAYVLRSRCLHSPEHLPRGIRRRPGTMHRWCLCQQTSDLVV